MKSNQKQGRRKNKSKHLEAPFGRRSHSDDGLGRRDDGTFGPEEGIAREDPIAVLWRYAKSCGEDVTADRALLEGFTDSSRISDRTIDAMAWGVKAGPIVGCGDGCLMPCRTTTRAEMAEIISGCLGK